MLRGVTCPAIPSGRFQALCGLTDGTRWVPPPALSPPLGRAECSGHKDEKQRGRLLLWSSAMNTGAPEWGVSGGNPPGNPQAPHTQKVLRKYMGALGAPASSRAWCPAPSSVTATLLITAWASGAGHNQAGWEQGEGGGLMSAPHGEEGHA